MKAEGTMTTSAERRVIFDFGPDDEAVAGLREVHPGHKAAAEPATDGAVVPDGGGRRETSLPREVPDKMVCSACRCPFTAREEQMEHYKLDWHRFNLRLKMAGMAPLTAEEFEKKTGAGDVSSISGSESDSEEDEDRGGPSGNAPGSDNESWADGGVINGRTSSKVVFQNAAGEYLSVHRCVLQGKSDEEQDMGSSLKTIGKKTLWIILMTGGGHFAGAVFQGREVLQHKTFHRYTVRAKRGTAQGLRDSQNRSHAPKSAGAALRRHNEAALVKDIQDLLASWAEHLKEAAAIFVRAPSYNKTIFFGGRAAPLDRKDGRVRTLPFATRRATFREVQRVHDLLSTVHIYGKDTDMSAVDAPSKKVWRKAAKPSAPTNDDKVKAGDESGSSDEEGEGEIQLEMRELTLGTLELRESEIFPSRHQRRRRRRKKRNEGKDAAGEGEGLDSRVTPSSHAEAQSQDEEAPAGETSQETQSKMGAEDGEDESWEYGTRDALFTACKIGDVDALSRVLGLGGESGEGSADHAAAAAAAAANPLTLLNEPIDSTGFTLLHVASAAAQKAAVRLLLDAGANPALRDDNGQTPYNVAPDKDTRNVFRKYMSENPDRYDYSKAQVPGPLTAEMESKKAEKKKAQKAQKKQREKTEKDEKRKQALEEEEKKRFASLSDREKRALAAEKRLADQMAATGAGVSNIKRCWQCGESLRGKVPFQYMDFEFCSPRCVQAHRKANAPAGKS